MPVIAVINRKGGSGKSTLATHLAAWLSHQGGVVMLGDLDPQQSARAWLRRRDPALPTIVPWAQDPKSVLRLPVGVRHGVLDTPGGLQGFALAKVIMSADAVLLPLCQSQFDFESVLACHQELMGLPRVAAGRCQLGLVGMRIDSRSRAGQRLGQWAAGHGLPLLGSVRETQAYLRAQENGLTLFDPRSRAPAQDLAQWEPILDWLRPLMGLQPMPVAASDAREPSPAPLWALLATQSAQVVEPLGHGLDIHQVAGTQ